MILSRELGKRIWGGSTNIENGGGGVSSDAIAGLLAGYAKESWVDEHYISIDFFSRLFQAHGTENGSEIDVMPNDMDTTITSVESMFGFWTNLYISALGSNGAAPAGISLGMLTDVTISGTPSAGQVLTFDAVTQKWVNGNAQAGATALANLTDVTLTSVANGQTLLYDSTTSKWYNSALKTINGQSLLGSGDISVGGGASGNYLPLTGGTMLGDINFNPNNITYSITWATSAYNYVALMGYYPPSDIVYVSHNLGNVQLRLTRSGDFGVVKISDDTVNFIVTSDGVVKILNCPRQYNQFLLPCFVNNNSTLGIGHIYLSDLPLLSTNGGTLTGQLTITTTSLPVLQLNSETECSIYYYSSTRNQGWAAGQYVWGVDGWGVGCYSGTGSNIGWMLAVRSDGVTEVRNLYTQGYVTALSDIRRKEVQDFDIGLTVEKVAEAPTIRFLWKDKKDDGMQVGSIAQFWQSALPEVVRTEDDGNLSLQYGVAALVSAIVTARKVVDHERRITELEKENERLKEEISQLRLN